MKANPNEYYRRIWNTVAAIPPGRVASYGQIAELAGHARGARAVSRALRAAPDGVDLPWHRVLNVRGRISIPKTDSAYREQVRRLTGESVRIVAGRVNMARYRWRPDLDELVWGPPALDMNENNEPIDMDGQINGRRDGDGDCDE